MTKRKQYFTYDVESHLERTGAMPAVSQYGGHKGNYGTHCMSFRFMGVSFWFSYQTLIAFHVPGYEQVVMKNYWRQTTGRHLGAASHSWKTERVSEQEFMVRLNNQLRGYLGVTKLTLPFLRVDQDEETLEYTGFIGRRMPGEEEVPAPKPKKSDFYLHPKKPSKYALAKERREEREEIRAEEAAVRREEVAAERAHIVQAIADEYGNQLETVEEMI